MLDGVTQNYNIGAIFRLCDAFLVKQLMICGTRVELHKRRLVQAAQGTQNWVPWSERQHASEAVAEAKARGAWVVVAEQTTASVRPEQLTPAFPATLSLVESGVASHRKRWKQRMPPSQSRCSEWQTPSMSRPPLPSCFIGSRCVLRKEREHDCQSPRICAAAFQISFRHPLAFVEQVLCERGRGHAPRADQRTRHAR